MGLDITPLRLKRLKDPATAQAPSPALLKYSQLIAGGPRGPILDAPCGYGRNALCFAKLGFDVYCVDTDEHALAFISAVQMLHKPSGSLICVKEDLSTVPESLSAHRFAAVLNVHFVAPYLVPWWKTSIIPGGFLYVETFDNRGENYRQLPKAGEIQDMLKEDFDFLLNQQRHAGPEEVDAVTLRLLAQKL